MPDKDTLQLENELAAAESVEEFFAGNEKFFQKFTLAQYLEFLLKEKNCRRLKLPKNLC